jgi:hypothetical protein
MNNQLYCAQSEPAYNGLTKPTVMFDVKMGYLPPQVSQAAPTGGDAQDNQRRDCRSVRQEAPVQRDYR